DPVLQPEASSPGAKDENTGAGLCRSRLVVQERLGHYSQKLHVLEVHVCERCIYECLNMVEHNEKYKQHRRIKK
ncbi:protein NinF, partial [Escherichia coli]|uniref:protein NinF n=1 Tax=Escherichia coli TaxID=562 RepID=UPI003F917251